MTSLTPLLGILPTSKDKGQEVIIDTFTKLTDAPPKEQPLGQLIVFADGQSSTAPFRLRPAPFRPASFLL